MKKKVCFTSDAKVKKISKLSSIVYFLQKQKNLFVLIIYYITANTCIRQIFFSLIVSDSKETGVCHSSSRCKKADVSGQLSLSPSTTQLITGKLMIWKQISLVCQTVVFQHHLTLGWHNPLDTSQCHLVISGSQNIAKLQSHATKELYVIIKLSNNLKKINE